MRYRQVTRESLRLAVARHLTNRGRVGLSIVPRGRTVLALSDSSPAQVS
jgi:hypothetical protein